MEFPSDVLPLNGPEVLGHEGQGYVKRPGVGVNGGIELDVGTVTRLSGWLGTGERGAAVEWV